MHASLDPNTVSDTKYTEYIKCVLEIDKRNRASIDNADSNLLTPSQHHTKWEKMRNDGFYPSTVDGKCDNGAEYYTVKDWKPLPLDASFYSYTAMKKDVYEKKHKDLTGKGYFLVYESNFKDCSGIERYQATWFKKA